MVAGQRARIHAGGEPVRVRVNACRIAGRSDRLAESKDIGRALGRTDRITSSAAALHVDEDRQAQVVAGDPVQHHGSLLDGFDLVDRLRVEVNAHLQPGRRSAADVRAEAGIVDQRADAGSAVADADDRVFRSPERLPR